MREIREGRGRPRGVTKRRREKGREAAKKSRKREKGSKLPDAKFFATNQCGDN